MPPNPEQLKHSHYIALARTTKDLCIRVGARRHTEVVPAQACPRCRQNIQPTSLLIT